MPPIFALFARPLNIRSTIPRRKVGQVGVVHRPTRGRLGSIAPTQSISAGLNARVFGSAGHSEADRTLDRVGAAPEWTAPSRPLGYWRGSRVVSLRGPWPGRVLPSWPPPRRGSRV